MYQKDFIRPLVELDIDPSSISLNDLIVRWRYDDEGEYEEDIIEVSEPELELCSITNKECYVIPFTAHGYEDKELMQFFCDVTIVDNFKNFLTEVRGRIIK